MSAENFTVEALDTIFKQLNEAKAALENAEKEKNDFVKSVNAKIIDNDYKISEAEQAAKQFDEEIDKVDAIIKLQNFRKGKIDETIEFVKSIQWQFGSYIGQANTTYGANANPDEIDILDIIVEKLDLILHAVSTLSGCLENLSSKVSDDVGTKQKERSALEEKKKECSRKSEQLRSELDNLNQLNEHYIKLLGIGNLSLTKECDFKDDDVDE